MLETEIRFNRNGTLTLQTIGELKEVIRRHYYLHLADRDGQKMHMETVNEAFKVLFENAKEVRKQLGRDFNVKEAKKYYGLHVTVKHKGKMRGKCSLSTSCIHNARCRNRMRIEGSVCKSCYASALLKARKGLSQCTYFNFIMLTTQDVPTEIFPKLHLKDFRIEAFGDVANTRHARNYNHFMKWNPDVYFVPFTKNPDLYEAVFKEEGKAENAHFVGSSMYVNVVGDFSKYSWIERVFTAYSKDYLKEHPEIVINCGAKLCEGCNICYGKGKGVYYVNEILK